MKTLFFKSVILILIYLVSPCNAQSVRLDRDFDGDGIIIHQLGERDDEAKALAIQTDGKILVAGYTITDLGHDGVVIRYNTDGSLDNTFNGNGIVQIDIGGGSNFFEAVAVQDDGKIIAAGRAYYELQSDIVMVRMNPDGSPDNTFGNNGIVHTNLFSDDDIYSVSVLEDGKIIIGGTTFTHETGEDVAILRYNPDGTLDPSFSSDGIVITCIGESDDRCRALLVQPDGKLVAAGFYDNADANDDFALVRYNSDGTLDHSFGVDGIVTTAIGESHDAAYAAVLQPDGKIILAGISYGVSQNYMAAARYNSDGSLDPSFSVDGKVTTAIGEYGSCANSIQYQPDGKIIIAGWAYNGTDRDHVLVRYNSNGTLDHSFDEDGIFILPVGDGEDAGNELILQSDCKILVAGYSEMGSDLDLSLIRLLNELILGTLDFLSEGNDMLVYPNPVGVHATIEFTLTRDEIISVDLYDMQGKYIQNFVSKERKPAGVHEESLFFDSSVPPGLYTLVISNDSGKQSIRIFKE